MNTIYGNTYESIKEETNEFNEKSLQALLDELEEMMNEEIDEFIAKQKEQGIKNKRNGYRTRTIITIFGSAKIKIPRDRLNQFFPTILIKNMKCLRNVLNQVIVFLNEEKNMSLCKRVFEKNGIKLSWYVVNKILNSIHLKEEEEEDKQNNK